MLTKTLMQIIKVGCAIIGRANLNRKPKKFGNASIFGAAALLSASCGSASPEKASCLVETKLNDSNIGPFKIGEPLEKDIVGFTFEETNLPYSDQPALFASACDRTIEVIIEVNTNNRIVSMSSKSSLFKTSNGTSVGKNLKEMRLLNKQGVLSTGLEEGGWVGFFPTGKMSFFEFPVDGISEQCLRNSVNCSEKFSELRATRYWIVK